EPWHKTESGGFLRNVVYGFNDGLTANFGLVAGVIGAAVAPHMVLLSGIAGMIADALSMGSSGYLAAKSEQEVYDHEIAMEKEEIRIMPEVEEEEIALVYQTKGIEAGIARKMAAEVMRDSQRALDEQVREELKIGEEDTSDAPLTAHRFTPRGSAADPAHTPSFSPACRPRTSSPIRPSEPARPLGLPWRPARRSPARGPSHSPAPRPRRRRRPRA